MSPKTPASIKSILARYVAMGNQYFNVAINVVPNSWTFLLGGGFLLLAIFISAFTDCPGDLLRMGLRLMFALAAALVISAAVGILEGVPKEDMEKMRMKWQGVSALSIFLIIYLIYQPNSWASTPCDGTFSIKGRVFLASVPLANARVSLPEFQSEDRTNSTGGFHLDLDRDGLSNSPLKVEVLYQKFDTTFWLQPENFDTPLLIHLKDTLKELTKELAESLIKDHLNDFQYWVQSEHLSRLDKGGRSCELSDIIQESRPYENEPPNGPNDLSYHRKYATPKTHTKIQQAGIRIKPFEAQYAHHLKRYDAFIWTPFKIFEPGDETFYLEYALENKDILNFEIEQIEKKSSNHFEIVINYQNPIRLVHVTLEFGEHLREHKRRKIRFYGVFPREKHQLKFVQERWHWAGVECINQPFLQ